MNNMNLWTIAVVLLIALILIIIGWIITYRKVEKVRTTSSDVTVTSLLMWWTALLASISLLAAIFAAFTVYAMSLQLDEMQVEQRAWVYADIVGDGKISGKNEAYIFPLKFIFHNTGHLPASFVHPELEGGTYAIDPIPGDVIIKEQNRVCEAAASNFRGVNGPGVAVFPGQSHNFRYEAKIEIEDWDKGLQHNSGPKHTTFVGCITYDNGIGGTGTTGVVFDIDEVNASFPNGQGLPRNPVEPPIMLHVSLRTQAGAWTAK